jgi:hypothetical protein
MLKTVPRLSMFSALILAITVGITGQDVDQQAGAIFTGDSIYEEDTNNLIQLYANLFPL